MIAETARAHKAAWARRTRAAARGESEPEEALPAEERERRCVRCDCKLSRYNPRRVCYPCQRVGG